jgi:hypothetical protein
VCFLTVGGCAQQNNGTEDVQVGNGNEQLGDENMANEDDFDFSAHMRVDERLSQIDWSGFEIVEPNSPSPRLEVLVRGFENNSEMFVDEELLRLRGSIGWTDGGAWFEARLNGEVIPYGDPQLYDYLKYGIEPHSVDLGLILFFVDLFLEKGQNTIEFFAVQESTEQMAYKIIYIYYEP